MARLATVSAPVSLPAARVPPPPGASLEPLERVTGPAMARRGPAAALVPALRRTELVLNPPARRMAAGSTWMELPVVVVPLKTPAKFDDPGLMTARLV